MQRWPFSFWVAVVLDHFSRKALVHGVYETQSAARDVTDLLDIGIQLAGRAPKYVISDQGAQFRAEYRDWCAARGIKPRLGAIGHHGSIAIVERFILSLKNECTRRIVVPLKLDAFQTELTNYFRWYNEARPHQSLGGRTPNEVYMGLAAARDGPKFESRPRLLKPSERRRANDRKVVPVDNLKLVVQYLEGRCHLPIVGLKRAA